MDIELAPNGINEIQNGAFHHSDSILLHLTRRNDTSRTVEKRYADLVYRNTLMLDQFSLSKWISNQPERK